VVHAPKANSTKAIISSVAPALRVAPITLSCSLVRVIYAPHQAHGGVRVKTAIWFGATFLLGLHRRRQRPGDFFQGAARNSRRMITSKRSPNQMIRQSVDCLGGNPHGVS
jgi:hypothetical protein